MYLLVQNTFFFLLMMMWYELVQLGHCNGKDDNVKRSKLLPPVTR